MAIAVEDPLIARMAIGRPLPIHESSRRLRRLTPTSPRVQGVAVLADVAPDPEIRSRRMSRCTGGWGAWP